MGVGVESMYVYMAWKLYVNIHNILSLRGNLYSEMGLCLEKIKISIDYVHETI